MAHREHAVAAQAEGIFAMQAEKPLHPGTRSDDSSHALDSLLITHTHSKFILTEWQIRYAEG